MIVPATSELAEAGALLRTMQIDEATLALLEELASFWDVTSKSDLITRCVRLAAAISSEIKQGGSIKVTRTDGTSARLMFQ